MAFSVGQIVRPRMMYPRRNGDLQDWRGYRSAQGWVEVDEGVHLTTSAQWWSTTLSTLTTTNTNERCYTLWIWDVDTASFVEVSGYPESALVAGLVGGETVTGTWFDPSDGSDPGSTALCRSRD